MGTLIHSLGHNTPGKTDIAVQSVLLFLDLVAVGMRLWSRRIQRLGLQANDWLIFISMFLMTGRYVVEVLVVLLAGLGLHVTEVAEIGGEQAFIRFKQLAYADDLLWVTLVTLIKLSILDLYIKVFRRPVFIRVAMGVMILCASFWIAGFFATAFFCTPAQKNWYSDIPGHCGDSEELYSGCASTDLVLDVITILLPMPVLWSLQLPWTKKVALTGVFALGFVIISITAVRIKYMLEIDAADETYSFARIGLLSAIVPLLGIVNACLPVLAPVIRVIFKRSTNTPSTKDDYSGYWTRKGFSRRSMRLEDLELPLVKVNQSTAYASHVRPSLSHESHEHRIHVTSEFGVSPLSAQTDFNVTPCTL